MQSKNFPYIQYARNQSPREWGRFHGESYREKIHELAAIRRRSMLDKNPALGPHLATLAKEQWVVTQKFSPDLHQELVGIQEGADLSIENLVILNNYTDFRDIELGDQGCSTAFVESGGHLLAGQTWDMHRSAKDFLCVIHVPESEHGPDTVVFSLLGCVGLTGFSSHGGMVGVNNINTKKAHAALIWPVLVRETLKKKSHSEMQKCLTTAPVTSGHNYLLASRERAQMWEIAPTVKAQASEHVMGHDGSIFHTNHCLCSDAQKIESKLDVNSTSKIRFGLVEDKIHTVHSLKTMEDMFTNHDGYPRSICSHFVSGVQDPSFTCGGAIGDLRTLDVVLWRGCRVYDETFVRYEFRHIGGQFVMKKT